MNLLSAAAGALAGAPMGLVVVAKCTALLGVAWLAHRGLAGRNPRWRVALWRSTVAGVATVAALSCGPPLLTLPLAAGEARVDLDRAETPARPLAAPPPVAITPAALARQTSTVPAPGGERPERPRTPRDASGTGWAGPGRARVGAIRPDWRPGAWLLAAWAAGVVVLATRLMLAGCQLSRIIRGSAEAPAGIARECREVAERLGCRRGVVARLSGGLKTPCLAGVRRPVLLLPASAPVTYGRADLRAILAHELAHARGHDLAWNLAAHLASIALWFHPLAWRLRAAHAAACDAVCDAVAADHLGDVAAYARTLARLALIAAGPPPATGLAMARASDVRRRIEALNHRVFRSPLPRRLVMAASLPACLLAIVLGGLAVTRAGPPPPTAPPEAPAPLKVPAAGRMEVKAVDDRTGGPIEGISIFYQGRFDGKLRQGTVATGKDGAAVVEWPAAAEVEYLKLFTTRPHYVPIYVEWRDDQRPIDLPKVQELRYEVGTTIGGVVKDEAGRPVAGAKLSISAPLAGRANFSHGLGYPVTDAEGRWRIDEAPAGLGGVSVRVEHPAFRPGRGEPSRDLDAVTVLKKGFAIRGRIIDREGRPIRGGKAVFGIDVWDPDPPTATADARGEFILENCAEGASAVTVQAEGFAPVILDVPEGGPPAPLEFRLGPAATIRARVVDVGGRPVAGAYFAAKTWRGRRTIRFRADTDPEGRIRWAGAPGDAVLYDVGGPGYMSRRDVSLTASDREEVITLAPQLVVSGRVTDAATGRDLPKFRVIEGRRFEGRDQVYWSRGDLAEFADGRYTIKASEPGAGLLLRVEAPGYKPANSRAFGSDEGSRTFDFALEPADGPTGVVVLPDGQPAAGVEVALATREDRIQMSRGGFAGNGRPTIVRTGADGRFAFPPPGDKFFLIALGEAGFADASGDEFAKSGRLALRPWGRIEGRALIGDRPCGGEEISFEPTRPDRGGGLYVFTYGYEARTDARGRFTIDRAIPGPGVVARSVITDFAGGSSTHYPCWQVPVEVKSGEAAEVTLGGQGRPVLGRVVLDGTPDRPVDWRQNEPATMELPRTGRGKGPHRFVRFAANLDKDGRFRVEDVPPGSYTLTIPVNSAPDPRSCGAGAAIGRATLAVTVPEAPDRGPLDLGEVRAELFATLKVGDVAPDFTARRLDGKPLRLGDHRGKLVLLDFWATWCGPCLAEMPALKAIGATFKDDPRFALVGLSCDQAPEPAAALVARDGLDWTQAFAGSLQAGVAEAYKVRALPATFLIGPDGRVLARDLRGPELERAIRAALKDDAAFTAAGPAARPPPRFPVTRFEAGGAAGPPPIAPAVAVLEDSDLDFEPGRPHRDALRLLDGAGRGVAALREFDTCQAIGGTHAVAIDATRGRIYLCELVAHRVVALDFRARKVWQVEGIKADALAVEPGTGRLWCCVGDNLAEGETVVLDPTGREVASYPVRGVDIAYDPPTDAFWVVGSGITKLSRVGEELFRKPPDGWACISVATDPRDGGVWIAERSHPDVARSTNRLWHLDARGAVLKTWPLGEASPAALAFDPRAGVAWVAIFGADLRRFTADGRDLPPLPIRARTVAVSPTTGRAWVATQSEVLQLDDKGRAAARSPLEPEPGQAWLAPF